MKKYNLTLNGFEIAVIGMSCRFPGARNINEYFNNLKNGIYSIEFPSKAEMRANGIPDDIINDPNFVNAGSIINDHDKFDAKFWNYTPLVAKMMSSEHKIALEEVWSAFENAGYDVTKYKKKIGIFFSGGLVNEAFNENDGTANQFELLLVTGADFLSTRIAYELGLTGPALNIQTACSSSLVAIHYACQSLLNGECSMAVAGGITIDPPKMGYFYEDDMIFSKDGYCRSFDNESTGAVFSSGCGCVILKPLEDALNDGDRIDAIIKGSSVNNDGKRKVSFTAPSEEGQFKVITQAINSAEIGSEEIGYIECHGTGTKLGDAIEIKALTRALHECQKNSNSKVHCLIGSVKSNIGHAQGAAGIAGFIKTVLSLKNTFIFPSLHYKNPSPRIDYAQSPLSVNTKLVNWTTENNMLRIAGVSSFGAGGTNAHIVLSEMPKESVEKHKPPYPCSIISLSAKSLKSLEMMRAQLALFIKANQKENLIDIAHMLHCSRAKFQYRHMFVSDGSDDAVKKLESSVQDELIDKNNYYTLKSEQPPSIVFLCSGVGEHYFNMAKGLYEAIPYYREQVDTCCNLLKSYLETDLLQVMFGDGFENKLLEKTEYMVTAVFTVGYAMAKLLMYWGINPQIMIGHSTGEYLAACLANVLSLTDMLHLVVRRAQIMDSLPNGSMIVVPMTEQEIKPHLNEEISIAAINGPFFCTLSGTNKSIKELVDTLLELGIASKYLPVQHAYHSKMMELGKNQLLELFSIFKFQPPTIPYISNLTGKLITTKEVIDPHYWYKHTCETVYFSQGLKNLFTEDSIYIEIGPGNNLVSALLQHQSKEIELKNKVFSTVRGKNKDQSDLIYFFNTIGRLWLQGVEINWDKYYGYRLSTKLELPTYQFEKNVYLPTQTKVNIQSISKQTMKLPIGDWFYVPSWKSLPLDNVQADITDKKILIFKDNYGLADKLISLLQHKNEIYKVSLGTGYKYDVTNKEYTITTTTKSDYEQLFADLSAKQILLDHVIHLGLLENNALPVEHEVTEESITRYQDLGFYSVLFLIQAMSLSQASNPINLTVVGNGVYSVTGQEYLYPEKATIQGLIKCIPQEYSHVISKYIDISFSEDNQSELVHAILGESIKHDDIIAYRNSERFILDYENINLPAVQDISKNFKTNGTYLITGGLGGLGFVFAGYLAKNLKANLILTYLTPLPARNIWDDYLSNPNADINIVEKIRRILQLEELGVIVYPMQADVCDHTDMQRVKTFAYDNFSKIDGIIHCAGITAGQFIINKSKKYSDNIFRPKLQGSINLLRIFGDEDIDFILLTSSTIAIACFMGQSDYSGANAFLDSFAYYCNRRVTKQVDKPKFLVINWDGWQEVGAAEREQENVLKKKLDAQKYKLINLNHHLFKTQISDNDCAVYYYVSKFSPAEHWFLSEHKLGGMPAVPGTLYIELLKIATEFLNPGISLYIENLKFISPLRISSDKSKEVFTVLNKTDTGMEARVFTYSDDNKGHKIWHDHVYGTISHIDQEVLVNRTEAIKKYIANIENECKDDKMYLTFINQLIKQNKENQVSNWGSRWDCIKQISSGKNCGILWLSLPESFSGDIKEFKLHPALLDIATSIVAMKFSNGKNYLPSSYSGITIFASLQQDIISYVEIFDKDVNHEAISCKIIITDKSGNILIEIQKFTMVSIESNNVAKITSHSQTKELDFLFGDNKLKHALTPAEGLEAFQRIIDGNFRHVLVSTTALKNRIKTESNIEAVQKKLDTIINNASGADKLIHSIWCKMFGYDDIDENDNFFEVGGNSLLAVMLRNQINKQLNTNISIVDIFAYPTIKKLNKYIFGERSTAVEAYEKSFSINEPIAVIGYSGIFPDSNDIEAYWNNIVNSKECLTHLNQDKCVELQIPVSILKDKDYIASGVVFSDIDKFDAPFWKLSPQDASIMDPQTRCFLEHTWKALEISGYIQQRNKLAVGIFCGSGWSQYLVKNLFYNQNLINKTTAFELNTLGDKDFLATQIAYTLDLHGPVMNIDTACSTSLVAIVEACEKLQSMKCDLAIAGGVNLLSSDQFGYCYKEGSIYSKDGYCRVFDSEASGTVISGGAGVIVLKRLSEAKRDNDNILAVVKGYGVNNDGRRKVGFAAPSLLGQKDCILESQRCAEVSSDDISYIECHGTGTLLGDPIEIQALTEAFRENTNNSRVDRCVLGSVKANIGHANKAAGVASFIKVCEMLKRKIIPPSINYIKPNPELKLEESPFEIITESKPWDLPNGKLRRAGVSSFGIGGTNAHVILEEAPTREVSDDSKDKYKLLCLSAKSGESLYNMQKKLREYLLENSEINLADVAYTLQVGRESFSHKSLIVCKELGDALQIFTEKENVDKFIEVSDIKSRNLIFMFSGQGTQHINMGKQLYVNNKIFRNAIDACAKILRSYGGYDLREMLYPEKAAEKEAEEKLNNTRFTQPALFVLEYALYKLWESLGIKPTGLIGHSLGEYVAACVSGIFSLEDALKLVEARGLLIAELPIGSMLAVGQAYDLIRTIIPDGISLAAVNTENSCVLSGTKDQIAELFNQFKEQGTFCHILQTSHAFHSTMMEPMLTSFKMVLEEITFNTANIPLISNLTGNWFKPMEAQNKEYWLRHIRETVNFSRGLTELFKSKDAILLEIGPGSTLANIALQQSNKNNSHKILTSLPPAKNVENSEKHFFTSFGKLWLYGYELNFEYLYDKSERRNKIALPTYIFDKKRYWVEPDQMFLSSSLSLQPVKKSLDDWFYVPAWKRLPVDNIQTEVADKKILIIKDNYGLADKLASLLQHKNDIYKINLGAGYKYDAANKEYTIRATEKSDYEKVFADLSAKQILIDHVIHLGLLENNDISDDHEVAEESIARYQDVGFYNVLFLIQTISLSQISNVLNLTVVGNGVYSITGRESLYPEKATIQGLIKCIPQEYSHIISKYIDIELDDLSEMLAHNIIMEMPQNKHAIVGYRNQYRWIENYENINLPINTSERLKENGTYLITGGLGGIGSMLAELLAENLHANLILIGRTHLPDKREWSEYLSKPNMNVDMAKKIQAIMKLESLGATVYPLCADVCSYKDMQEIKVFSEKKFGKINGIFHCAGVASGKFLYDNNPERINEIIAPKLIGTLNLYKIFHNDALDMLMLFSSTMSIRCIMGQADYAGANAFLDSFAHYSKKHNIISVNWDVWHSVGMAEKNMQTSFLGIQPHEGLEVFKRLLFNKKISAQVIVSTTNNLLQDANVQKQQLAEKKPEITGDKNLPFTREKLEQKLMEIWQDILGHSEINLNDNFFNLGGNSLKIIKMKEKIDEIIFSDLKVTDYFNYPTINLLVQRLAEDKQIYAESSEQKSVSERKERINVLHKLHDKRKK